MTNLLYVCRWNIDRSPVAEQITRRKTGVELNVSSAGLSDYHSYPCMGMSDEMRKTLKKLEYLPERHYNRRITNELLRSQDIILCMQKSHVNGVLQKEPDLRGKVHTLPEYAGLPDQEIYSPSDLIREIPAFSIFSHMPYNVRGFIYRAFGHTDPRDYEGVIKVHMDTVKEIELYVDKAIERMIKEGLIPKPILK